MDMFINVIGVSIEYFDSDPRRGFMTLARCLNTSTPKVYTDGVHLSTIPSPFDKGEFELPKLQVPGWLRHASKEAWELFIDAYSVSIWETIGEDFKAWVKANKA